MEENSRPSTDSNLSYTSAISELETILRNLDEDDVDIDALTSEVERAAELIDFCRARIDSAKTQVEQVVAGLDEANCEPKTSSESK